MQALGLDVPAPVRAGRGRGPLRDSGAQMRTVLCARSVLGVVGYICRRPALKTITAPHAGRDSGAAHDVVQRGSRHARRAIRAALCPSNGLPSPGRRRRRIRRLDSTGIGVGRIDDPGPGRSIALERSQAPRPPSQARCECPRGAAGSRPDCVPTVRKLSGALPGTARPGFKESSKSPASARPDKTLRQRQSLTHCARSTTGCRAAERPQSRDVCGCSRRAYRVRRPLTFKGQGQSRA